MTLPPAASNSADEPVWWVRALASLPLSALYGVATVLALFASSLIPYRREVVRTNLATAFPALAERELTALARDFYRSYADVLVELIKSPALTPQDFHDRVRFRNIAEIQQRLAAGKPVLLVAAHQCNWEWMLQALVLSLGYPVDAAYKPLIDPWAETEMQKVRTRFGAHLVPAQSMLSQILARRNIVRAIAMVADQEPEVSDNKYWARFLNRDSAFYVGAEEIARKLRYPAYFMSMQRTSRGHYEIGFELLADDCERLTAGSFTEKYVRLVEQQIHDHPADWTWSHKRWRLKKPLYAD